MPRTREIDNAPRLTERDVEKLRAAAGELIAAHGKLPYGWAARQARALGVHRTTVWRALSGRHFGATLAPATAGA